MFSKGLSEAAQKRVELAVAVAQEKLLSTHVDHALDLIALVNDEVSFIDALEIYARLLRLDDDEAQNLSSRALAILGERAESGQDWETLAEGETEAPDEIGRGDGHSLFGLLRDRLRGRVNEDLRWRVELVAARAEVALIETHMKNALHFADFLGEELEDRKAVELYLDALDVRESVAEVTYYLALSRIADTVLPEHGSGLAAAREAEARRSRQEAAGPPAQE